MAALPYGATRAADWIPRVLCNACQGINLGTYVFCQFCKIPAYRGEPVPRSAGPPTVIFEDKLNERIHEVLSAVQGTAGQQRKSSVADSFDGFVRARSAGARGWKTATDVDVFEWLCWLDSHGKGTKLVHAPTCPGVGTTSTSRCKLGSTCAKRYGAASLATGYVSRLKCVLMEQLGKLDDWDCVEKRGNPVASPLVRSYMTFVQGEQRKVGVGVKQASPLLASQVRDLVVDMRRRLPTLTTAAARMAMTRDVAVFCLAFHTMKRGFDLSVAVAAKVLRLQGGEGFIFNFLFGKTLRSSSQAVVVKKNLDCRAICAVAAMLAYQQAATSLQWSLGEGAGFLFPTVRDDGTKGEVALTPAQMTTNLQAHLRAAGITDQRYTLHSFRVGGAASHNMDGTAMDVLMEYVGWKSTPVARRYAGQTASAVGQGANKRSRDTAFLEADALPLSDAFMSSHVAFPNKP
ncbi:unnamed protein product [Pylaiella littoralis]